MSFQPKLQSNGVNTNNNQLQMPMSVEYEAAYGRPEFSGGMDADSMMMCWVLPQLPV
jgi:hypothetical protein